MGSPFSPPQDLGYDAGYDGNYAASPDVLDMAACVFLIIMRPSLMVQANGYKDPATFVLRLLCTLVECHAFREEVAGETVRRCHLHLMQAAASAGNPQALFNWLVRAIEVIKLRPTDWQDLAEAWKWLKEGRYRPMMAVLIINICPFPNKICPFVNELCPYLNKLCPDISTGISTAWCTMTLKADLTSPLQIQMPSRLIINLHCVGRLIICWPDISAIDECRMRTAHPLI